MADTLTVQIVFAAGPGKVFSKNIHVARGTSLREAVDLSGLQVEMQAADLARYRIGVWGKAKAGDAMACDGDRIEIYRPLSVDPKLARARRARKKAQP